MTDITTLGETSKTSTIISKAHRYLDGYLGAKGTLPPVVHVYKKDFKELVKEAGTDDLTMRGVPVKGWEG